MKTIAILAQKGGVGKTTLTLNLAIAAKLNDKKAAVIDMDPQKSSADWVKLRSIKWPIIKAGTINKLPRMLQLIKELKVDFTFIDTLPTNDNIAKAAAQAADLIIIPIGYSILDLRAINPTVEIAIATRKPTFFVINRVPYRSGLEKGMEKALSKKYPTIPVASIKLTERTTHARASSQGKGVMEDKPKSAASMEMKQLYQFMIKQLKELT